MTNRTMNLFCEKLESVQDNAVLAITDLTQGASCYKIYWRLGLESLKSRRWYKRLSCIFKIMKKKSPNYLINFIRKCEGTIRTRNSNFVTYNCRTDSFKYSFFPSTLNDWFRLDISIKISESILLFKSRLAAFFNFGICSSSWAQISS